MLDAVHIKMRHEYCVLLRRWPGSIQFQVFFFFLNWIEILLYIAYPVRNLALLMDGTCCNRCDRGEIAAAGCEVVNVPLSDESVPLHPCLPLCGGCRGYWLLKWVSCFRWYLFVADMITWWFCHHIWLGSELVVATPSQYTNYCISAYSLLTQARTHNEVLLPVGEFHSGPRTL